MSVEERNEEWVLSMTTNVSDALEALWDDWNKENNLYEPDGERDWTGEHDYWKEQELQKTEQDLAREYAFNMDGGNFTSKGERI